ncbi:hypothetical protein PAAG_03223 [Paracoccidioides lutzii Pb01]|uniref:Uncharacterized protein n=1 Tax=Paracoccidioides lutzii (strain ATCC MYA-826 / Pb01) TaxID=502779 RepID=C1GYR9_PARBA|nr:hypothetical protein PAAG_03223 [Paracoccidioides lutzii Pb01]EEH41660.2 hypothetical protein PAAG_03223 [Paracoccidioides lutzii Pb01]
MHIPITRALYRTASAAVKRMSRRLCISQNEAQDHALRNNRSSRNAIKIRAFIGCGCFRLIVFRSDMSSIAINAGVNFVIGKDGGQSNAMRMGNTRVIFLMSRGSRNQQAFSRR